VLQRGLVIRAIYALCLAGAAVNHVRAVVDRGWLPASLPFGTAVYWSSLTFFDPLAAILLFVRPRVGIAATVVIILTDVVHNLWFAGTHAGGSPLLGAIVTNPFLLSQISFLLFVALTASMAWSDADPKADAGPVQ
jgi:hypothetical protein